MNTALKTPITHRSNPIAKKFAEFDKTNPHIWERFVHYTWQAILGKTPRISARGVVERIRWDATINPEEKRGFRVSGNFVPFYARKFQQRFPEHKDIFGNRQSVADRYRLTA